jgi:hypothetical protein
MNGWTDERRRRQAALIHRWQPWKHSTGPRTPAGKARASRNAFKNSPRQELRRLARWFAEMKEEEREMLAIAAEGQARWIAASLGVKG